MADPQPPLLPEGAPKGLRDFFECRELTVSIANGPLTWVDLGLGIEAKPDTSIKPGATPGTATISIDIPMVPVFTFPASVKKASSRSTHPACPP